jgi:tetratricopeptide (TPR) repeat protein
MKKLGIAVVGLMLLAGLCTLVPSLVVAQPRPMAEDVFTPIAQGYDFMQQGKYEAAEDQFKTALKRDRYNPFALNNLAAIEEKNGKLKDAMAYLVDAKAHATEYFNKVQQTCFVGGICAAVKPLKETGTESYIAPIINENMAKLAPKVKALPAEPTAPPAKK